MNKFTENNTNIDLQLSDFKKSDKIVKVAKTKQKKKKKKTPKDAYAPKHPLTGYVRFMNVRRDELRKIHPNATAIDITKMIGEEWNVLKDEHRKPYLEAAEIDKERYSKEWAAYTAKKKSDESSSETTEICVTKTNGADTTFEKDKLITTKEPPIKLPRTGDYDIPIFTEEFLDHNKIVDTELRSLRKSNTDYEQQNSILEKYVDNMKYGVDKLINESNDLQENNAILSNYLSKLKMKLAIALSGLSIPGEPNGANLINIDKYMEDLHQMATSNSHGPASLNKARDIIRKLDLQTQIVQ